MNDFNPFADDSPSSGADSISDAIFANDLMNRGFDFDAIQSQLVERGVDPSEADTLVKQLRFSRSKLLLSQGKKNMIWGMLCLLGGSFFTWLTYYVASVGGSGGKYVITWGAVVFGTIQFFHGVSQCRAGKLIMK